MLVRRLLSSVLAVIVAVCSAAVSSPHVHAYGGHEHPEHQHGPASHRHEHHHGSPAAAAVPASADDHHDTHHGDGHDDDGDASVRREGAGASVSIVGVSVRIEACDAGDHAVRIPGAAAPATQAHVPLAAVLAGSIVVPPVVPARFAIALLDVRVHGPPPDTRLPARAPPLTSLA